MGPVALEAAADLELSGHRSASEQAHSFSSKFELSQNETSGTEMGNKAGTLRTHGTGHHHPWP